MKFIPIFIAFFACAHEPTIIKKAASLKKKKIVSNVEKTINCAQDEAKVLKELVAECKAKFEAEIKRFKQNKCEVPDESKKKGKN